MNSYNILAFLLIAVGILGLVFSQVSYTKGAHKTDLGPLELTVNEKQTIEIPIWAGAASIVAGSAMLLYAYKQGSFMSLRK